MKQITHTVENITKQVIYNVENCVFKCNNVQFSNHSGMLINLNLTRVKLFVPVISHSFVSVTEEQLGKNDCHY